MPLNSSLTQTMVDGLQIKSFIYHVIRNESTTPDFYDEIVLAEEQRKFFVEQIQSASSGTQFIFDNPETNTFKSDCLEAYKQGRFNQVSRELAQRFRSTHDKRTNDGVFIFCIVSVPISGNRKDLIAILKVDFSTVYQQTVKNEHGKKTVSLKKVVDSLADNQAAIQKWAIIDPHDVFTWDVVAMERGKGSTLKDTAGAIAKYFKGFLQVKIKENASTLTRSSLAVATDWAKGLPDIPEEMMATDYKARAINYLNNSQSFDSNEFAEQVVGQYWDEEDSEEKKLERSELRERHKRSLIDNMEEKGVAGQVFQPKPGSIPKKDIKNTIKTRQGLEIQYQGTLEENQMEIKPDGQEHVITIRTSFYENS